MHSFTAADMAGSTLAAFAFALFLLPPGYLLGWATNVLGFRRAGPAERLLASVALSMAATPVLSVLLGHMLPARAVVLAFALMAVGAAVLVGDELYNRRPLSFSFQRSTWIGAAMAAAWFAVVALSLADLQIGQKLYCNYAAFDHAVRQALVQAAARGIPPRNPFFGVGEPPLLRYFYYWYAVCALPMRLAGVSARAALNASVFWCGLGLASLVPLYLKHFFGEARLRLKSLVGIALLAVTGLDVIPSVIQGVASRVVVGDIEWWDPNQVTSWAGSLLWTPHHVAGLVACLVGFLVLATLQEAASVRERACATAVAGVAFASAAGLSVFVTLVFAIFLVVWSALLLIEKRLPEFFTYVGSAAMALLLSVPFLRELQGPSTVGAAGGGGGSQLVQLAFRGYPAFIGWLRTIGIHNTFVLNVAKLPTLVVVYFLEFGFFAVVAAIRYRELRSWEKLPTQQRAAWLMLITALVAITFLASTATDANDLGIRGAMVVQFILLLWAAPLVTEVFITRETKLAPGVHFVLLATLALGALGTVYQLASLRLYAPLADRGVIPRVEVWMGERPDFSTLGYEIRSGFEELDQKIPKSAVVQYSPFSIEGRVMRLYSRHQMVASDSSCGAAFGGDVTKCKKMIPYLGALFEAPSRMLNWDLDQFCDFAKIDVLVTTNVDPAWRTGNSWVWAREPIVSNHGFKAIKCGTRAGLSPASLIGPVEPGFSPASKGKGDSRL